MSRPTIGIVDYGVGNVSSVKSSLKRLGYRCILSCDPDLLEKLDVIVLPGVGAFPAAMAALSRLSLDELIRTEARRGKPIIGICLGMQLLAEQSTEIELTAGLGLIPGHVTAITQAPWHIGWNSIEVVNSSSFLQGADGQAVYFNHSFVFEPPMEYCAAIARIDGNSLPFTAAVQRNNVVGVQFHPEKSQGVGSLILAQTLKVLCSA